MQGRGSQWAPAPSAEGAAAEVRLLVLVVAHAVSYGSVDAEALDAATFMRWTGNVTSCFAQALYPCEGCF